MRARRLVILDASGAVIASLDLTGIVNGNAAAVMLAAVEEQCDLGHWHETQAEKLRPWGPG